MAIGPPISFLYLHFHNAMRRDVDRLQRDIRDLETAPEDLQLGLLLALRDRCRFLNQVHSYHSSVEDEVRSGPVSRG